MRDGAPSQDQQSFLSHMGLTSGDSRGLRLPDLLRFNPNLEELIGDRRARWERGTPPSRRPDVARVLPLVTAASSLSPPIPPPRAVQCLPRHSSPGAAGRALGPARQRSL